MVVLAVACMYMERISVTQTTLHNVGIHLGLIWHAGSPVATLTAKPKVVSVRNHPSLNE